MLEMKAQTPTAVLGRQLHSLLGCYTLSPCQDNLKLLPSTWWWGLTVLQCNAIEGAVLGLLVTDVSWHWQWQQQQLKQSVKSHPRATSFAGQNTPKNACAVPLPGLQRCWVKGSEQSPPSVGTAGISKETNSLLQLPLAAFPSRCTHECSTILYNKSVYWWVCLGSLGVSSSP